MSQRTYVLMLILLGILVAGLLYLRALGRRIFFEPPQQTEETARARLSEVALQSNTAGPSQTATLYFPSPGEGKLVSENRSITWADTDADRVRQVLLALIEGPRGSLSHPLPPSATVRGVFFLPDGTAYVDLSNDILSTLTPGIESETLAVYSIVDSIASNIPAVKKVKILIQGQEVETLDGHVDLSEAFVPDPNRIQSAAP
jgi:spore germination protein GerM